MLLPKVKTVIRDKIIYLHNTYLRSLWGMKIGKGTKISFSALLDRTNPSGIFVGKYSYIARNATILTHDYVNRKKTKTVIGDHCFIGMNSVVMPGIKIGNSCIVAAGSIVTKDISEGSIVAGNPAVVIKMGIKLDKWGQRYVKES